MESAAQYKAAVQLLLENAQFEGNDKKLRAATLFRTEKEDVIKGTKIGELCKNTMGAAESFPFLGRSQFTEATGQSQKSRGLESTGSLSWSASPRAGKAFS